MQQTKINKPAVDYAFDILDNVAQKDFTKWSIVYDLKNKKIYFKTANYPDVKSFSFKSFDFTCASGSMTLDMNQAMKGDISANFKSFNNESNREIVEEAVEESKSQVPISDKEKDAVISYSSAIKCN